MLQLAKPDGSASAFADDAVAGFGTVSVPANHCVGTADPAVLCPSVAAGATTGRGQLDN